MTDFIDVDSCTDLCTFAIGKTNLIQQAIYTCETCAGESNVCCCAGCAEVCHKGHEVNFVAFGEAYCDCGHGGCQLFHRSQKTALKLLGDKTISFDKNGRVGGTDINNHFSIDPFAVNEIVGLNAQSASVLQKECISLVAHSKETFWLGMTDQPRCLLEETASLIFQHHISKYSDCASLDPSNTGAEWWTQVKYCDEETTADSGDDSSSNVSSGVDLHYDKDEEVASLFGVGIFPHISTVTYLTDNSSGVNDITKSSNTNTTRATAAAPTIVFETTASQPVGSGIKRCFVSLAEIGKHVSFDGRYLHGAPAQLRSFAQSNYTGDSSSSVSSAFSVSTTPAATRSRRVRVTFLVNVWLNHHPAAITALPADIVHALNNNYSTLGNNASSERLRPLTQMSFATNATSITYPVTLLDVTAALTEEDGDGSDLGEWQRVPFVSKQTEWGKGDDEAGLALVTWIPYSVHKVRTWQSTRSSSSSGNKKKKTKLTHTVNSVDSKNTVTVDPDAPLSNTFQLTCRDKTSHSRLEYDEDSEAEDDFAGEFDNAM